LKPPAPAVGGTGYSQSFSVTDSARLFYAHCRALSIGRVAKQLADDHRIARRIAMPQWTY